MNSITRQIVLVGGGYASIWAYRSIVDELLIEMMAGQIKIIVICPDEFHLFHGWTAESLVGIVGDENRMSPLKEIFKHAELIKGRVVHIDPTSKIVNVSFNSGADRLVSYDQILLATGSTDSTSVTGIERHAFRLKSEDAFCATKLKIKNLLQKAAESNISPSEKTVRFVIAGSGFTGLEVASNLAEFIKVVKRQYSALRDVNFLIYLINSKKELLPDLPSGFRRIRLYSEKTLRNYGVEILNQVRINRVTERGVFLSDGAFLECEMVISTIGQNRTVLPGTENLDRDFEKKIYTNSFLQTINYPNIWVAGDSSHARSTRTPNVCPSNALWAIKQGEHAGRNITRSILAQSLKPFSYRGLGQCASLGVGKGIGELYGIQFTGWIAWIMRWIFFQYFMPSKKIMLREVADWLLFFSTAKRKYFKLNLSKTRRIFQREHQRSDRYDAFPLLVKNL
jgi:NADH:ubiquinone reductase (H+-translocating)